VPSKSIRRCGPPTGNSTEQPRTPSCTSSPPAAQKGRDEPERVRDLAGWRKIAEEGGRTRTDQIRFEYFCRSKGQISPGLNGRDLRTSRASTTRPLAAVGRGCLRTTWLGSRNNSSTSRPGTGARKARPFSRAFGHIRGSSSQGPRMTARTLGRPNQANFTTAPEILTNHETSAARFSCKNDPARDPAHQTGHFFPRPSARRRRAFLSQARPFTRTESESGCLTHATPSPTLRTEQPRVAV
jgi:hypothetical protein